MLKEYHKDKESPVRRGRVSDTATHKLTHITIDKTPPHFSCCDENGASANSSWKDKEGQEQSILS